jgi:hypothetical protein
MKFSWSVAENSDILSVHSTVLVENIAIEPSRSGNGDTASFDNYISTLFVLITMKMLMLM